MTKTISRMDHKNQEVGFTLVELLVVVLIIGVLTAIAIPAFMNQRTKANTAALESDLRNTAMAYRTWQSNPSNNNDAFRALTGNSRVLYLDHPEANNNLAASAPRWRNFTDLPEASVSRGTTIEMVVNTRTASAWDRVHDEGEFCLIGQMVNSDHDHSSHPVGGAANYDQLLFYDHKLGGVKTMDEIVAAIQSGQEVSCHGHPKRYMTAHGL